MRRLLLFLALFAVQVGFAQEIRVVDRKHNQVAVLGEALSTQVMFERFGAPKLFEERYDEGADLQMGEFVYKTATLVVGNGYFYSFSLRDNRFEVIVNDQYRVKVGDKFSEFITSLPEGSYYIQSNEEGLFGIHWKTLNGLFSDCSLIFRVESDTIRSIVWDEPI